MSAHTDPGGTGEASSAQELYDRARGAMAQLHPDTAADLLDRARELLADTPQPERDALAMRIDVTGSWITLDREGPAAALERLAALERRALALRRPDLQVLPIIQSGVVWARRGDMSGALSHLRRAVPLAGHLPTDDRVRLLLNKGTVASQCGHWGEASADLGEASRLAADAGLGEFAFMARHNQGYVEYLRGDLPAALRLMQEADDLPVDTDRGVSRFDRARVLLEAGLVDDAASLLGLAVEALRAVGMIPEQAEAELDLAACEALRSRPERARDLAAGVAERAVARGESGTALRAGLVLLDAWLAADRAVDDVAGATGPLPASAADAHGRRDDARRIAGDAGAAGLPRLAGRAHLLAAIIDTGLGDLDGAAADLAGGAPLARSPHLATRTLVARAGLLLARARGDRDEASAITRRVRRDVARAGSGMASLDLRTAVGLHLGPIIGLDLERAASGSPWQLLLTAERWRAATAAVPSLRPPRSERAAAEWSRLRVLHDEVRAAPPPDQAGLHEQIAAVEMRLRRIAWADGGTGTPEPPPGGPLRRERLDAALRDHDAMAVSLQWIRGRLHAVVVHPGGPARHVPLLTRSRALALRDRVEADLAATARTLAAPGASVLAPVVRASLAAGLAAVDAEVLQPCARAAGDPASLVIVPTGPLATVPWSMLASRAGRPTTVTRSLATWLDQDTRIAGDMGVAAVAGPDVPGGEREVTGVLDAWTPAPPTAPGVTARRLDSTPAAVVDAVAAAADLVHIAAHGRHRRDNPLFSSVWLTGGSLFAHEFEGRPHRSSQVVLSSCGTGGSTVRPGDEPLGFASGLLAFGVAAVVAPVSDVPDDTARRTMLLYHRRLAAGTEASVALAGAVAEAAAEGHWLAGAFTCFGAPWARTDGPA